MNIFAFGKTKNEPNVFCFGDTCIVMSNQYNSAFYNFHKLKPWDSYPILEEMNVYYIDVNNIPDGVKLLHQMQQTFSTPIQHVLVKEERFVNANISTDTNTELKSVKRKTSCNGILQMCLLNNGLTLITANNIDNNFEVTLTPAADCFSSFHNIDETVKNTPLTKTEKTLIQFGQMLMALWKDYSPVKITFQFESKPVLSKKSSKSNTN